MHRWLIQRQNTPRQRPQVLWASKLGSKRHSAPVTIRVRFIVCNGLVHLGHEHLLRYHHCGYLGHIYDAFPCRMDLMWWGTGRKNVTWRMIIVQMKRVKGGVNVKIRVTVVNIICIITFSMYTLRMGSLYVWYGQLKAAFWCKNSDPARRGLFTLSFTAWVPRAYGGLRRFVWVP